MQAKAASVKEIDRALSLPRSRRPVQRRQAEHAKRSTRGEEGHREKVVKTSDADW